MKIIVGLGNPGPSYAKNRHNVGYQCVKRLAQRCGATSSRVMFKGLTISGHIAGVKVVLARPLTFMNLSGQSVGPLLHWYHADLSDLLVICDDLDLPLGKIRLRRHGGSAGHKGMRSVIDTLGTQEFARLRIGIGRPAHGEPQGYVLDDFSLDESIVMQDAYDRATAAVEAFVAEGIAVAMNQFNSPNGPTDAADSSD